MPGVFTISLSGLNAVNISIDNYSKELFQEVDYEFQACALNIVKDAKVAAARNAKNLGFLARGISQVKKSMFNYQIISAANYSAFMEFGTKSLVSVPSGFEDLANSFKGVKIDNGSITFKQAIYTWAEQKGISEKLWYPIYMKIAIMGVKPHPFLIPAYVSNTIKLQNRLNLLLNGS